MCDEDRRNEQETSTLRQDIRKLAEFLTSISSGAGFDIKVLLCQTDYKHEYFTSDCPGAQAVKQCKSVLRLQGSICPYHSKEGKIMEIRVAKSVRAVMVCCLLPLVLLDGCAARSGAVIVEGEEGTVAVEVDRGPVMYRSVLPAIPPGHMPPPGKCRIWYPGRPPGQQPPPGDCWELQHQVPPGAWLISG